MDSEFEDEPLVDKPLATKTEKTKPKEDKEHLIKSSAPSSGLDRQATNELAFVLNISPPAAQEQASTSKPTEFDMAELRQFDRMINWMIISYLGCLALGLGLLFFDWAYNKAKHHNKQEPWVNDAVIIGGASAVLSPIIQWGHTILHSKPKASPVSRRRYLFFLSMWSVYVSIVSTSVLVALIRFASGEDGSLHHFIATTSNHLVFARISASLISWTAGKLFIRWYKDRLSAGPMF